MRALVLALVLTGCTSSRAVREACYAKSEANATQRAMSECVGSWDSCAARPSIMAELAANQAGCP